MTTRRQVEAIVGIAGVVVLAACTVWSSKDPRLVAGSVPREYQPWPDYATTRQIMQEHLTPHIGGPFPDLTLIDRRDRVVRLSSLRGHRVAILSAITSCPVSIAWLKQLRTAGWHPPSGFDSLVVLVNGGGSREWNDLVRDCPQAFLVGWPLEQYLEFVRVYPVMFAVSPNGNFEGMWQMGEAPPAASDGGTHSDTRPTPPRSAVTALAQGGTRRAVGRAGCRGR